MVQEKQVLITPLLGNELQSIELLSSQRKKKRWKGGKNKSGCRELSFAGLPLRLVGLWVSGAEKTATLLSQIIMGRCALAHPLISGALRLFSFSLRHHWILVERVRAPSVSHWVFMTCLEAPKLKDVKDSFFLLCLFLLNKRTDRECFASQRPVEPIMEYTGKCPHWE